MVASHLLYFKEANGYNTFELCLAFVSRPARTLQILQMQMRSLRF